MNNVILNSVPVLRTARDRDGRPVADTQRLPTYNSTVLTWTAVGQNAITVNFSPGFQTAITDMIEKSDDPASTVCIHNLGYSYINGVMAAGGFLDPSESGPIPGPGMWVGGDYTWNASKTPHTVWPYARTQVVTPPLPKQQNVPLPTEPAGVAATPHSAARLMVVIATRQAVNPLLPNISAEMLGHLANANASWLSPIALPTTPFKANAFTYRKIGTGPLAHITVLSEVIVLTDPVSTGHQYVVAWQNLPDPRQIYDTIDIANLLFNTITSYETGP
jgi:hypothetical protein